MNQVAEKIAAEIRAHGAIPFVRFMELALYCPVYGYYEKEEDTIGRRGDYFTNVSVGPLFGQLLASQFVQWLENCPKSKVQSPKSDRQPLQLVEAGAHRGALALDILNWFKSRCPGTFERLEYWIIEPSRRRQEWQRKTLGEFPNVRWAGALGELTGSQPNSAGADGIRGVIFCNELLDAMPVRRFGWDAARGCWFEWGVTEQAGRFTWIRINTPDAEIAVAAFDPGLQQLAPVLPDGFSVENCPAARDWWSAAARAVAFGKLVAIDYGLTGDELITPERCQGTLRAYRRHRPSPDPLADPGEQDLTVHVNFEWIQKAGESAGLSTEKLVYQEQFLTALVQQQSPKFTAEQLRQFQTLTHPEHLGRAFRVLVQSRSEVSS